MRSPPFRRATEVELMDSGDYTPAECRGNLVDLRFLNAWTGATRVMKREVRTLIEGTPGPPDRVTLLDVATGAADIPAAITRGLGRRGLAVFPLGCDANADVLALARGRRSRGLDRLVRADAARLPHADASIDVVICSNFLHHLDDETARVALGEMKRVARRGLVVCDLTRTSGARRLVWIATRLTSGNRITRHDGPLSVDRAFTLEEMGRLAEAAGMRGARLRRAGPVRMVLRWARPVGAGGP